MVPSAAVIFSRASCEDKVEGEEDVVDDELNDEARSSEDA